jgi:Gas vesicle protein G
MILLDILSFPFTAPINGTIWVIEQLREKALAEISDPDKLRADLIQLRISYDRGTISEEEYSEQADEIWERLKLVTADSEGDINGDDADEE